MRRYRFLWFGLIVGVLVTSPEAGWACGGFFCTTSPMNQVSEQILFVADPAQGVVTTHVQIQYTGDAHDFAWVLPVPSLPELKISHNEIFRQLGFSTQPRFVLNWDDEAQCAVFWPYVRATAGGEAEDGGGVEVVSQERVGPYEATVITADDPEAMVTWLRENKYQLDALGVDLLRPYVEGGFFFVALRLAPDKDLGDLQPLAMTYAADRPGIPIQLTAVATEPDLGVLVWVMGQDRAIPKNYLHVQINEAKIDWFNGGTNYTQVVGEAANEAGGQAFATDYAGSSKILDGLFYPEGQWDLDRLRLLKDPVDFLDEMLRQGFPRDAQTQALIRRRVPMSQRVLVEGVLAVLFRGDREAYDAAVADGSLQQRAEQSFYNNMEAYREYLVDMNFDPVGFADDLETVIVEPLRAAQDLVKEFPYLTRLYTTLSASEMTVDPMFDFNPDLPEVPSERTADARLECPEGDGVDPKDVVLVVTLKDGREIRSRPFAGQEPGPVLFRSAAAVVERMDVSGQPEQVRGLQSSGPDFDGNGKVDFNDFIVFAQGYGGGDPAFDLTGDGRVDLSDFLAFARSYANASS
ncbi:MAG: DUF2330 domain-containing protein [bacterium]|nr:DUF2330 domain-containing protein [bacterium]